MSTHWKHESTRRRAELAAAPTIPEKRREYVSERMVSDAIQAAVDIRDIEPARVWGRLNLWMRHDPERVMACCIALAAMVDTSTPTSRLLAWTDTLA